MRIICDKCHGKARITTRREITPRFTKLYCVCNNAECGHSFVMHLEFAHSLSPSGLECPPLTAKFTHQQLANNSRPTSQ
ncbi:ogr/Delta-like zinc finger family protein [Nitratidesulfovibrio sp. HK-II]|uniref:ogr/Delta-like zinc finger family protein n=1 Tax=Nitratidesulfovibrio sp. HK-II TaxID=2009266 RepID=UPI000E2EEFE7|nr:ogr/Delta-like zinc finger family protein [Nitratidesulfovibrio sp. HK-II]